MAPKLEPLIVTIVPEGPEEGLRLVIVGDGVTAKVTPLLANEPTVTTILPVVAPRGATVVMLVLLQLVGAAGIPLKEIELNPWVAPKLDPLIVTSVPTGPDDGVKIEILGKTVNGTELLAIPATVTTTLPDVAAEGTVTTILVAFQLVGVAIVPLKNTLLVPCVPPKFVPVIVTWLPTGPEVGFKLEIDGAGV